MKLAIVTDCLSRNAGGLFHSVRRLAQELHHNRIKVQVFGVADDCIAEDISQWLPLRPRVFPCRGPTSFGYAAGLERALADEQASAIQIHGIWKYTSVAVRRVSKSSSTPYVVHPHGMLDAWALRHSRFKKRLAAWAYERRHLESAACIRALNASEARAIRAFNLRNPICIIPNAVDVPSFGATSDNGTFPFPAGRKVVLFLGRIHPKKNLVNLLNAWAIFQSSIPRRPTESEWVLAIAGWNQDEHEDKLKQLTRALRLEDSVLFLGPRFADEKTSCLRHSDAFILPSYSEGLPMAVLEAWAHARPVLMTAECNLPEGFTAGAAINISTSPESIAQGMVLLRDMTTGERAEMGYRGLKLVKDRYTWPSVARNINELYRWILGGGPAPSFVEHF